MSTASRRSSRSVRKIVVMVGLVLVVVAMVASTKFLTAEEVTALNPPPFSAQTYAAKAFPEVTAKIKEKAVDIAELAPAVDADVEAAGKKYGQNLGSGSYSFAVKATGKVTEVDSSFVLVEVPGVPSADKVRIPVGAAVSGTPIRDATGSITFGDFTGQTDFQSVANQLKLLVQSQVLSKIDPESLKGKEITVYGAWSTGGPANSYIIQPVSIEVGS